MSDFLGMSDEDFLKQASPGAAQEVESPESAAPTAETPVVSAESAADDTQATLPVADDDQTGEAPASPGSPSSQDPVTAEPGAAADENKEATPQTQPELKEPAKPDAEKAEKTEAETATTPDYAGFYAKVMTPFKANGKTIELRSPEEAIQLMQMGANYTRKMQELAPHRKVLMMLENNGLLDEGKLSYLIDLEKKNPAAITKLVKDAGLDPMEIDTSAEPAYRAGNHRVTDEEASFRAALDDLKSTDTGLTTIQAIDRDWDDASKDALWKEPQVLAIIHQQRESGIYDRIAAEVNRQRTLGAIAPQVPFLHAYKYVGDEMVKANAFADLNPTTTPPATTPSPAAAAPAVVTTRVATPKPAVTNGDKASAASTTRTTPQAAKQLVNPLALSDDEFLKQFAGRL